MQELTVHRLQQQARMIQVIISGRLAGMAKGLLVTTRTSQPRRGRPCARSREQHSRGQVGVRGKLLITLAVARAAFERAPSGLSRPAVLRALSGRSAAATTMKNTFCSCTRERRIFEESSDAEGVDMAWVGEVAERRRQPRRCSARKRSTDRLPRVPLLSLRVASPGQPCGCTLSQFQVTKRKHSHTYYFVLAWM